MGPEGAVELQITAWGTAERPPPLLRGWSRVPRQFGTPPGRRLRVLETFAATQPDRDGYTAAGQHVKLAVDLSFRPSHAA